MSYSVSLDDETPQPYRMKVMSELLVQAHIIGLDVEEFVGFFATQVQAMLASPPNYNKFGQKARVWIMRGFYPSTHIFFKISLMSARSEDHGSHGYYARVSPMRINYYGKGGTAYEAHMIFDGRKLNDDITNRMENSLLGANHKLDPILLSKLKMPRCMSPRGMKIFRYKRPSKRKNEKAS